MSRRSRDNWGLAAAGFMQGLFGGSQMARQQQMSMDEREARRGERAEADAFRRQQHDDLQAHRKATLEESRLRREGAGAGGRSGDDLDGGINRNIRDMTGRTGQLPQAMIGQAPLADAVADLFDKGYTPERAAEAFQILSEGQGVELDLTPDERLRLGPEFKDTKGPVKLSRTQLEDLYGKARNDLRKKTLEAAWERAGSFVDRFDLTEHHVKNYLSNIGTARERRRAKMGEAGGGGMGGPSQEDISGVMDRWGGLVGGGGSGSPKAQMLQQQVDQAMAAYIQGGPGAREAREWLNENWVPSQGKKLGITELIPTAEELEELEAMAAMTQPQGAPIGADPADAEIMQMRGVNPQSRPSGTAGRPAQGQRSGQSQPQGARAGRERDYERVQAGR